jgi:hypothetical protein
MASSFWLGCVGGIEADGSGPGGASSSANPATGPGTPGSPAGGKVPSAGGSGAATPGPGGSVNPAAPGDPNAAGTLPLRRLTRREYNATVRDLLGDTTLPADQFPSDRDDTFAFRRSGVVAVQDATLIRSAAESLAAGAVRNLATLLPCNAATAGEPVCAKQFVDGFGPRAYRRPLSQADTDHLMALYTAGRTALKLAFPDAIGLVIEGILQSPAFLYHWEAPPVAPVREGMLVKLSPYEVASRLSYFLWGSMPDKDLFAAAAANKLGTPVELDAQARRLLADARAKDAVAAFFDDWLNLDGIKDKAKDAKAYPEYNDALKTAMTAESRAFFGNVIFDGDGRWSTLLGATYSFVNQALGGVYGLPQVRGTAMQRTDLNPAQRAGFLTQPGFLALTGAADGSHPVRRGLAVYEKLLCRELPPPPANVPPAKPPTPGVSTRQRFIEHDMNECAKACHAQMDSIGFAFENYDGIGKYRTMDNGQPVDATGSVSLDGSNKSFANAVELSGLLAKSDDTRRCFATEWMRFALVRSETAADQASVNAAAAGFARTESGVRDLLVAVATSRTFRYRSPSPGEVLP